MEVRHVRGQIVGKRKDLRLLTKQWWMAIEDENGEVVDGQWVWHDADFGENVWHHKEQKMSERKILVGEGECLGIYHGKKNMKKALKSGELVKKKFKDSAGKEHVLYERFQVAGQLQNSTNKKNYKLEALIYENYKLDGLIYEIYK